MSWKKSRADKDYLKGKTPYEVMYSRRFRWKYKPYKCRCSWCRAGVLAKNRSYKEFHKDLLKELENHESSGE